MLQKTKRAIEKALVLLVGLNALSFLLLAYLEKLSTDPQALVFIDFWGRLCVYSLWFVGYTLYRRYAIGRVALRTMIQSIVIVNIPVFLLLGYFDKLSTSSQALPFIDFWGRLTVYSLWFIAYEFYRKHIQVDAFKKPISID